MTADLKPLGSLKQFLGLLSTTHKISFYVIESKTTAIDRIPPVQRPPAAINSFRVNNSKSYHTFTVRISKPPSSYYYIHTYMNRCRVRRKSGMKVVLLCCHISCPPILAAMNAFFIAPFSFAMVSDCPCRIA